MKDDAMSPEIQGPLEARKKSNKTFPASDTKEPDSADTFILPLWDPFKDLGSLEL